VTLGAAHFITGTGNGYSAALPVAVPAVTAGPNMVAGQQAFCLIEGTIEPATAGTLGIRCATSATGVEVTVLSGCYISFEPLSVGSRKPVGRVRSVIGDLS
jgi:hypothetical protein